MLHHNIMTFSQLKDKNIQPIMPINKMGKSFPKIMIRKDYNAEFHYILIFIKYLYNEQNFRNIIPYADLAD